MFREITAHTVLKLGYNQTDSYIGKLQIDRRRISNGLNLLDKSRVTLRYIRKNR